MWITHHYLTTTFLFRKSSSPRRLAISLLSQKPETLLTRLLGPCVLAPHDRTTYTVRVPYSTNTYSVPCNCTTYTTSASARNHTIIHSSKQARDRARSCKIPRTVKARVIHDCLQKQVDYCIFALHNSRFNSFFYFSVKLSIFYSISLQTNKLTNNDQHHQHHHHEHPQRVSPRSIQA